MLNPKLLRDNLDDVCARLANRGMVFDRNRYTNLETQRKALQIKTEQLQNQRNQLAKAIAKAKIAGKETMVIKNDATNVNNELMQTEQQLTTITTELNQFLLRIPNLPALDVPVGKNEQDNQEIRRWHQPRQFDFTPKDHVALGEKLGLDFNAAVKLTGARFMVLHGVLAKLHRALIHFMLDYHTRIHGYQEVYVPYIVNSDSLLGTGQLPQMQDDLFALTNGYYLIPTGEVPVTNLYRDTLAEARQFSKKYVCHTPCFRSEAGSYGKDTRGMVRQHQFEKVELVQVVTPDQAITAHEELTAHAEAILQQLGLPYRVMVLCTSDMGFNATKTYDLEVWLPGQQKYREISSCSHCGDFQARRLQARYKDADGKKDYLHTINGSGLAIGRTLVALLENYQDADGNVHLPEVLHSYMDGLKVLSTSNNK